MLRQLRVLLPGCGVGRLRHPRLTHGVEVGILVVQLLHPLGHGVSIGIGIGIHADAVNAYSLYPPDAVLDKVAHQVRIALVQVGHSGNKPALSGLLEVYLRGVGIHDRGQLVGSLQEAGALGLRRTTGLYEPVGQVQPVLRRHVAGPGMLEARVVEDHVHNHLQPFLVGLVTQTAVVGIGTEARVHLVVVRRGIAVIGRVAVLRVGRVVIQYGCQPQGRDTQLLEVVQVFADAVQVAAMAQRGLCAVFLIGAHTLHLRIVPGTLCKAIGHEHVEHVTVVEPYALVAAHLALLQLVLHLLLVKL